MAPVKLRGSFLPTLPTNVIEVTTRRYMRFETEAVRLTPADKITVILPLVLIVAINNVVTAFLTEIFRRRATAKESDWKILRWILFLRAAETATAADKTRGSFFLSAVVTVNV